MTGREPKGRGARADEALDLLARLWSEERVTYEGQFYRFADATISPRPVQQPLPLWIGGSSEAAIRRTARVGTGWLAGLQTPAQVAPVVRQIKDTLPGFGRTIDDDHYGAGFSFRFGTMDDPAAQRQAASLARLPGMSDPAKYMAVGDTGPITARLREYIEAGVSKFVLRPIAQDDADMNAQTRRLLEEVVPLFAKKPVTPATEG